MAVMPVTPDVPGAGVAMMMPMTVVLVSVGRHARDGCGLPAQTPVLRP